MRWYSALALKIAVHCGAAIVGIIILLLGLSGTLIALGGTGGLTSSPPPEHPLIGSALLVISICVALAAATFYGWRALVRVIDRIESR